MRNKILKSHLPRFSFPLGLDVSPRKGLVNILSRPISIHEYTAPLRCSPLLFSFLSSKPDAVPRFSPARGESE